MKLTPNLLKNFSCLLFAVFFLQTAQGQVSKNILVEEITNANCGLCPGAFVMHDSLFAHYDNLISVRIHTDDNLAIGASEDIAAEYTGGGAPAFLLDRTKPSNYQFMALGLDYPVLEEAVIERLQASAEASVTIENVQYDETAHSISLSIRSTFYANFNDELRTNIYIVENDIVGEGIGYDQVNYYDILEEEEHPYAGLGNPMNNYQHNYVLRTAIGGAWGMPESISSPVINGQTVTNTYEISLDPSWKMEDLSLIGMVQKYHESDTLREILNSEITSLTEALAPNFPIVIDDPITVSTELNQAPSAFATSVYPNPIIDQMHLQLSVPNNGLVQMSIYDHSGSVVYQAKQQVNTLKSIINTDLAHLNNGLYILQVQYQGQTLNHKIQLLR